MPETNTITTRFEPAEERTFKHLPFSVPDGVLQLHLSIRYNDRIGSNPMLSGGNTLDIGLFDAEGTESGGSGLRGWSGSERTDITIDSCWATPPYRAGDIMTGEWNVLLGAYKIGPNGLDVTIDVTFNSSHIEPEAPAHRTLADLSRASLPRAAQAGWYRGDLHMHSVYSDGDSYPHEIAELAYETGLDFYAITDHNRAQSPVPLVPHGDGWPVLVRGVEVTTYAGHFNVWGTDNWYDFREPTADGLQSAVDAARADGGLISLNHPKPFGPMWDFPQVTGFDAMEPWNGWWGRINNFSIGYWADALNGESARHWHVGVGGSDAHNHKTPGNPLVPVSEATIGHPTLWIQTDQPLSEVAVLDAIRAGRCFISESPSGPQLYAGLDRSGVVVRTIGARGDCLMAIGSHGCLASNAINANDETMRWRPDSFADEAYIRFELHTPGGGIRAMSNPVWLQPASTDRD